MNAKLITCALSAAMVLTLNACGGGGGVGSVAGIGGSGFISSGSVTGFGSVFVNGVKFETGSTIFDIDDSGSGSQADLAIGMVVTVSGTVNADGTTGTATSISFDDQLQGPVSTLTAPDLDGENRNFKILGKTVLINAINTVFDVSGDLPQTTPFNFGIIANGNNVEISGFWNDAGELVATRVELKATVFDPSNIVELKGTVTGFTDVSAPFTLTGLNSISIDASAAAIDDLPNGLTDGVSVEVKGTCSDAICSTLNATRVEGQNNFDDADKISVEGIITDFVDSSNFKINGISVDASSAILQPATLELGDGTRVEVEGPISNNTIQAFTVELRGGNAKVHATVSSVDPDTGDFVVTVNSSTIAVTITTATEMENSVSVDDFVRVRGFENDTGGITATRVEVRSSNDDVIVQGALQAYTTGMSIQLLGVNFTVDLSTPETEFQDANDNIITEINFEDFTSTSTPTSPGTLVKVKDRDNGGAGTPLNGIADEIEIETP